MTYRDAAHQREVRAAARKRGIADPSLIPHGTLSGYQFWGCRCSACRARVAQAWRERAARRHAIQHTN